MSVPVVVEAVLELEPLAREAQVVGCGDFGDVVDLAEGPEDRFPGEAAPLVGHARGTHEMVGVDEVERRGRRHIGDDGDRDVVGPDIFALGVSSIVRLDDDPVGEIVDEAGEDACGVRH